VDNRDRLQKELAEAGIGTGIHYPIPLHLQDAYRHLGYQKGDFPVAEKCAGQILSLPIYPQLDIEQQRRVVREMGSIFGPGTWNDEIEAAVTASSPAPGTK
jgi:dTDP-4-amino-4,6-dideoxygalactose transaminase